MGKGSSAEERERLCEAVQESQAAAKALTKDAAALSRQAAHLQARAAEARAAAQEARAQAGQPHSFLLPSLLLTIPEAARHLQVPERTLRVVLAEPDLQAQLIERTRKVGIYYKFIPLLPPDLMDSLNLRFEGRKNKRFEK